MEKTSSSISEENAKRVKEPRRYPVWLTREEAEFLVLIGKEDRNDMDSIVTKVQSVLHLKVL